MNKFLHLFWIIPSVAAFILILLYFFQESLIFQPTFVHKDQHYKGAEEWNVKTLDGFNLNSLLLKADSTKGVVLYFHGNGGNIYYWADWHPIFTENQYDVLFFDYRSYGKSEGHIENEEQFLNDAQLIYDKLREKYAEKDIVLLGTSMGSGVASRIAMNNKPKALILQSPYFSLESIIKEKSPFIPDFIIKYRLKTSEFLKEVQCPIYILHGTADPVIPIHHSRKLKELYPEITLIEVEKSGHNGLREDINFCNKLRGVIKEI